MRPTACDLLSRRIKVASVFAYLLSDAAAMVNGICMPVDGGFLIN